MNKYITVDGGTTNTRIRLICGKEILAEYSAKIGAGNKRELLSRVIHNGICDVTKKSDGKISAIIAGGMITSECGIYNVPHINAPVGLDDLAKGIKSVVLEDISEMPINFIPGVKKQSNGLNETDMMRGEECEFLGVSKLLNIEKNSLVILPGSHTKIISADCNGKISDFSTSMSGEMIAAISGNTILCDAVNLDIREFDEEYLKLGYEYCLENGLNEALFKVRILKNIYNADDISRYSFFTGAILCADITKIKNHSETNVYVGGKKEIKDAIVRLLNIYTNKNVDAVSAHDVDLSASFGMICIYEQSENLQRVKK